MTTIKFYVIKHVAAEDYRTFLRTRPGDDPSYEVYTSYIDAESIHEAKEKLTNKFPGHMVISWEDWNDIEVNYENWTRRRERYAREKREQCERELKVFREQLIEVTQEMEKRIQKLENQIQEREDYIREYKRKYGED